MLVAEFRGLVDVKNKTTSWGIHRNTMGAEYSEVGGMLEIDVFEAKS